MSFPPWPKESLTHFVKLAFASLANLPCAARASALASSAQLRRRAAEMSYLAAAARTRPRQRAETASRRLGWRAAPGAESNMTR